MQELLGDAHATDVERDEPDRRVGAEDELGRAAADVDDEIRRGRVEVGRRAEERQRRFFVAREQLRGDTERVARGGEELVTVGGVACRARGGGAHLGGAVLVDRVAVLAQHVGGARDRVGRERPGAVDALRRAG